MGEVRRWIRLEFPGQFVAIVSGAVGLAAVGVIGWAMVRIREARAARYGLIVLAAGIAVAYARWSALGMWIRMSSSASTSSSTAS